MVTQTSKSNGAPRTPRTTPSGETTLSIKRKQWLECLHGEDENSIGRQIEGLLWGLCSWSTINYARKLAPRDENGGAMGCGLLHGLLDRCFVTSQMLAVRRLCDGSYSMDHKKQGIWSVVALRRWSGPCTTTFRAAMRGGCYAISTGRDRKRNGQTANWCVGSSRGWRRRRAAKPSRSLPSSVSAGVT